MKAHNRIESLKKVSHIYREDIEAMIGNCADFGIDCVDGEDGYMYLELDNIVINSVRVI